MTSIVVLVGLMISAVAVLLLIMPEKLRDLLHRFLGPNWLPLVSALRIVIGLMFILAAPYTRLPILVSVIGGVAIVAGIVILLLGVRRTQLLADWWLARSNTTLRLWAVIAALFGGLLVWAGV